MSEKKDEMRIIAASGDALLGVRSNEEGEHLTVIRHMEEGRPLAAEVIDLKKRDDDPNLYNVKTLYKPDHAGPARANSKAYRDNWDDIFGSAERPDDSMLN